MLKRYVVLLIAILGLVVSSSSAAAMTPAPGWEVFGRMAPTNLAPGMEGILNLYVENVGGAPGVDPHLTDILPPGLTVTQAVMNGTGKSPAGPCAGVGTRVVTCTVRNSSEEQTAPINVGREVLVEIEVKVAEGVSGSATDYVSVVGGGALEALHTTVPVNFSTVPAKSGFSGLDMWATNVNGTTDTQAGSHPFDLSVAFAINSVLEHGETDAKVRAENQLPSEGVPRDIDVNLPPGIIGDALAVPQCPRLLFQEEKCPNSTMIGWDWFTVSQVAHFDVPIYNLVRPAGTVAQFGFNIYGTDVFLDAGVRSGGDNGITEHSDNIPERGIMYNYATIWGVPGEEAHRSQLCPEEVNCPSGGPAVPLLTLPTSCQGPQTVSAQIVATWEDEDLVSPIATSTTRDEEGNPVGFTGCDKLAHFEPTVSIAPDTSYAETPAGLSVTVTLPQERNPEGLATSGLQDTTVTLPEGVNINPGQATGLVACQPAQEELGETNEGPADCPAASTVGTDEITTPLLAHPLKGKVYVLQSNPPTLQLLMTASGEGANLKLVGTVHLNETTGRLTTTFEKTPDVPFTEFILNFSGGPQAALVTPRRCGTYETNAELTPWSSPFIDNALWNSRFQIAAGPDGSPCQWPLPFEPTMTAGATTDQAGGYTDFTMLLQRGDDNSTSKTLQFKTPEGLLGMISQVPLCEEPQAEKAGTCSAASQIGHTVATAGPGPYPFEVPQAGGPPAPIYLTGPYDGAPFGLSIVVPDRRRSLQSGDGNRHPCEIEVDPHTSRLTITTEPLPLILDGIPTDLRL